MGGLGALHHPGTQSELDELCLKHKLNILYCITSPGKIERKQEYNKEIGKLPILSHDMLLLRIRSLVLSFNNLL